MTTIKPKSNIDLIKSNKQELGIFDNEIRLRSISDINKRKHSNISIDNEMKRRQSIRSRKSINMNCDLEELKLNQTLESDDIIIVNRKSTVNELCNSRRESINLNTKIIDDNNKDDYSSVIHNSLKVEFNPNKETSQLFLEYTSNSKNSPNEIPLLFERFVIDYLEPKDYFNVSDPEEIVQIIQHFSYWLYENNHSVYRVTLVNLNVNIN